MLSRFFRKKPAPRKTAPKKTQEKKECSKEEPAPSFKPGKLITAEGWKRMMLRRVTKKKSSS